MSDDELALGDGVHVQAKLRHPVRTWIANIFTGLLLADYWDNDPKLDIIIWKDRRHNVLHREGPYASNEVSHRITEIADQVDRVGVQRFLIEAQRNGQR